MIRERDLADKFRMLSQNAVQRYGIVHSDRRPQKIYRRAHQEIVEKLLDICRVSPTPEITNEKDSLPSATPVFESTDFNPYNGWVRDMAGDQPLLETSYFDGAAYLPAIPEQVGFLAPNGTPVQMSAKRATELGLMDPQPTKKMDVYKYGQQQLETREDDITFASSS